MHHRKHHLALALQAVLAGSGLSLPAMSAWAEPAVIAYDLPRSTLEESLSRFAQQAG